MKTKISMASAAQVHAKMLKKAMDRLGMRSKHLADLIERTPQYVSNILGGRRPIPLELFNEINEHLGNSLDKRKYIEAIMHAYREHIEGVLDE